MTWLGDLLRFLTVFCSGVATGTWIVTQRALIPLRREVEPAASVHVHVVTSREIDRYQPPCVGVATFAGLGLLLLGLTPDRAAFGATLVGFVCLMVAGVTSIVRNVPINHRIAGFAPGSAPAEYADLQRRWNRGNVVRTIAGLVGFAAYVIAAAGLFR
jgi:uncharacterized membrane protein